MRKWTFAETHRQIPGLKGILVWALKLLRRQPVAKACHLLGVPFQDFVVTENEIPPDVVARFQEPLSAASRLGFLPPIYKINKTLGNEATGTLVSCRHADGESLLRLAHSRVTLVHSSRERMRTNVTSWFSDGTRLVTSDRNAGSDHPRNIIFQRCVGAPVEALYAAHRKKLEEMRRRSSVELISSESRMAELIDQVELEFFDFQIKRGVYVEVPPEEIASLKAKAANQRAEPGITPQERLVLTKIQRAQSHRGNWYAGVFVTAVSLITLKAIIDVPWNWQLAATLAAVVAFHELGHFVAMRALHYKDVRMFFVPKLGAAISGRLYNVSAWRRAVAAMAGPIPGILAGCVLAGIALSTHNNQLQGIASLALLFNGVNLLPIVPLDGAWILQAILFSRNSMLEKAFFAFAGAALVTATLLGLGSLWMCFGILTLVALPAISGVARIATRLRASGLATSSIDGQTVPPETALAIFREAAKEAKEPRSINSLATQTLDIFQRLNAIPPSVVSSVILFGVYLIASVLVAGGLKLMPVSPSAGRQARFANLFPVPTHSFDFDPPQFAGMTNDAALNWRAPQLIATFNSQRGAGAEFTNAAANLASNERIMLFGESIFLSTTNVSNWRSQLRHVPGAAVFLEHPDSNQTVSAELTCEAPNDSTAAAIESDCDSYFSSVELRTWPPWASLEGLDAERVSAIKQARYTWPRLLKIEDTVTEDPAFVKVMAVSMLRSKSLVPNAAQTQKWMDERRVLGRREFDRLLQSSDPELDKQLVSLYESYWLMPFEKQNDGWQAFTDNPVFRSGSVTLQNDFPADAAARTAAVEGVDFRDKRKFYFRDLRFYRTDCGMAALVSYLRARGCHDFKYEFHPPLPLYQNTGAEK